VACRENVIQCIQFFLSPLEIHVSFAPAIDPAIWALAPGFRALSLHVQRPAGAIINASAAACALQVAVSTVQSGGPPWAEAHMQAWAEVFRRFGAKPQRTPCSAQALRERVLKTGGLSSIDPVVDHYNAISLKYAVSVGGENVSAYHGIPRLVVAEGSELFDTMKNGMPATECPEKGEVVWRDDQGVTCRRWNWRQGVRTRIDASTTDMWFVLESLPEMPLQALHDASADLQSGLNILFGNTASNISVIRQG
jgi:DNA/RNA-binding domain of Phe-tRNA-synthetase-like protein